MIRVLAFVCGLALAPTAIACRFASDADLRSFYRKDRSEQRELVQTLAHEADEIFVAKALSESPGRDKIDLQVSESLKGTIKPLTTVTYPTGSEITVSCGAAPGFRDAVATTGSTYIVYIRNGVITRAGDTERESPEISFREERRLVRRILKL